MIIPMHLGAKHPRRRLYIYIGCALERSRAADLPDHEPKDPVCKTSTSRLVDRRSTVATLNSTPSNACQYVGHSN